MSGAFGFAPDAVAELPPQSSLSTLLIKVNSGLMGNVCT